MYKNDLEETYKKYGLGEESEMNSKFEVKGLDKLDAIN